MTQPPPHHDANSCRRCDRRVLHQPVGRTALCMQVVTPHVLRHLHFAEPTVVVPVRQNLAERSGGQ
jgi:hypothetical protein